MLSDDKLTNVEPTVLPPISTCSKFDDGQSDVGAFMAFHHSTRSADFLPITTLQSKDIESHVRYLVQTV